MKCVLSFPGRYFPQYKFTQSAVLHDYFLTAYSLKRLSK